MAAKTFNAISNRRPPTFIEQRMAETAGVPRTPAEKARILARLTLVLAAINKEEGCTHGNA